MSDFDQYAGNYSQVLDNALSATGESKDYFALRRAEHFAACLERSGVNARRILDFGCGPGSTSQILLELLNTDEVIGVDESPECIARAAEAHSSERTIFFELNQYRASQNIDAVYCNGVFHHIVPDERGRALQFIGDCLRPGGLFAFWENNPWNPGTKYVMSQCPFDEDAITIAPSEARRMLLAANFEILRTDFLFFFPRQLAMLRPLEPMLMKIPFGGQYQVLCRKSG